MKKLFRTFYLLLIFVSLFILYACGNKVNQEQLKTVNSKSNLISILKQYNNGLYNTVLEGMPSDAKSDTTSQSRDYSKTNTQVDGVDESDVVKTDGENIYSVTQHQVVISKAYPANQMEVLHILDYSNTGFYPNSLYVDEKYLVVIGSYYDYDQPKDKIQPEYYYHNSRAYTRVYVYDKNNYLDSINELNVEGYLVTTRKNEQELLLITNQYINYWQLEKENVDIRPRFKLNDETHIIDYNEIYYKEGTYPSGFVTIMRFDISSKADQIDYYTYMGSSDNVYVSKDTLYITQRQYSFRTMDVIDNLRGNNVVEMNDSTFVTKVPLNVDYLKATKTIEVKGHINNQFSLDEYNDHFRIVTTHGNTWDNTAVNNLYIYNNELKLIGKIENMAKGEQIQSARFVGDRIYMVTFRTVDPFFVIDAKDPTQPKILGELKIPGYSTYLHPYDENHIIGFGFETTTINDNGNEISRIIGLKISLFDVTNPAQPISKANTILPFGEAGYSYSELSYNHKALLFSKSKNIIAFPITTTTYKKQMIEENGKLYESYQYLYRQSYKVYNISLDGFTYKADLSHFTTDQNEYYRYGYEIMRGLYIENYLYTISPSKIQAHQLTDYSFVDELELNYREK